MTDPSSSPTAHARMGDRSLFPDLEPFAYLNHAAISPPSLAVRDAVHAILDDYLRRGVSALPTWLAQRERLRDKLASLIGGAASDVAFVPNTTRGVTDVALCLPWEPGDRILLLEGEFPANVSPWQRAAERFGLEIAWLPVAAFEESHEAGVAALCDALDRGVRLVAVSAVQFQTGLRMPVAELARACHERGAELFVDAIQGCGVVPLDVVADGIDYLSCGGHKWLMGPEGTGFLYVEAERAAALRPLVAGWLSHEDGLRFLFEGAGHLRYDRPVKRSAAMVEGGAYNGLGLAGLEASVDLILALGVHAIHQHVQAYLDPLEAGLRSRGFASARAARPEARSGILSVRPPEGLTVQALQGALSARGVAVTIPDGWLRFAPHWPNAPGEVPRVLAALDEVLGELS